MERAPHRTAIYRTRKKLAEEYMKKLNRKILERLGPARQVSPDATGMRQSKRDCTWSSTGNMGRKDYVKLHGLFNLETRALEAFEITAGTEHECNHLGHLLDGLDQIECVLADSGYLSRENCRLVAEKGGTPYIKPKKNGLKNARGCFSWRNMVALFLEHPQIFSRFHRLRERAESGWHSLKSIVGDVVRCKTIQTGTAKVWPKITCYNLIWAIRGEHAF